MAKCKENNGYFDGLDMFNGEFTAKTNDVNNEPEYLDISLLKEFTGHPFKVIDDDSMEELKDSIADQGIINPIIVRPIEDGGYEILVGHRRVHACSLLGMDKVPVRIVNVDDDDAALYMVDSNIQRTSILPSERAFAYKMKMEALEHKDKNINTGKVPDRAAALAKETNSSKKSIYRYIKLTNLIPELLELVDQNRIKATANGQEIADMPITVQKSILEVYNEYNLLPSTKQAVVIKNYAENNEVTKDYIYSILTVDDVKEKKINFSPKIKKYFPKGTSAQDMEDLIITLLENAGPAVLGKAINESEED